MDHLPTAPERTEGVDLLLLGATGRRDGRKDLEVAQYWKYLSDLISYFISVLSAISQIYDLYSTNGSLQNQFKTFFDFKWNTGCGQTYCRSFMKFPLNTGSWFMVKAGSSMYFDSWKRTQQTFSLSFASGGITGTLACMDPWLDGAAYVSKPKLLRYCTVVSCIFMLFPLTVIINYDGNVKYCKQLEARTRWSLDGPLDAPGPLQGATGESWCPCAENVGFTFTMMQMGLWPIDLRWSWMILDAGMLYGLGSPICNVWSEVAPEEVCQCKLLVVDQPRHIGMWCFI